mgnify:FL=1
MTQKESKKIHKIVFIAIINLCITALYRALLFRYNALGIPVIIPLLLWFFMIKTKKWAYIAYSILTIFTSLLGLICFPLIFMYIYRGYDPTPCILAVLVAINYGLSWKALKNFKKKIHHQSL